MAIAWPETGDITANSIFYKDLTLLKFHLDTNRSDKCLQVPRGASVAFYHFRRRN